MVNRVNVFTFRLFCMIQLNIKDKGGKLCLVGVETQSILKFKSFFNAILTSWSQANETQWLQNPNFPIRAVFGPTDFKSAVLFFGSTYSENKKCSEIILYLILR